jgi:hypothetical protein
MSSDDWEVYDENQERVDKVREYFLHKPVPGPESSEETKEDVGEKITESMLKALRDAKMSLKMAELHEKQLSDAVKKLAGKDRGVIQRGKMICKISERAGQTKIQWNDWFKAEYNQDPSEVIPQEFIKTGQPSVVISEVEELP